MIDECFSTLLLGAFPSVLQAASHAGAAAQEKFPNLVIYLLQVAALSQSGEGPAPRGTRRGRGRDLSRGGMNSTLISVRGGGVLAYYCARAMTSAAGASMSSTTSTANGAPAPSSGSFAGQLHEQGKMQPRQ